MYCICYGWLSLRGPTHHHISIQWGCLSHAPLSTVNTVGGDNRIASGSVAKQRLASAAPLLLFFLVAVILQYMAGAYRAELSGYPDEPAHFVTGRMVADYMSTFPHPPMLQFAEDYYIRRPKVAIGHWPPLFYIIEGLWFLLFDASRRSVLLLMALISSVIATIVYAMVRSRQGWWAGLAAGLVFLLLPTVQTETQQVMVDKLVCLFGLCAVLAFADFISRGARGDLFRFAVFAILAIFSKTNGLYLALFPPLALLFTKRLRLLASPWLWVTAALVGVPAAAWVLFSARFVLNTWVEKPSLGFVGRAVVTNAGFLASMFGTAFLLLILAGLVSQLLRPLRNGTPDPLWGTLAAGALSVFLFQSIVPAGLEPRFLIPLVPLLILFMFAGIEWLADLLPTSRWPVQLRYSAVLVVAALLFAVQTFAVPQKPYRGFSEAADFLVSLPEARQAATLVSSETDGEGLLIAEITMREHPQTGFVLRGSKVLSESDWLGRDYHARFSSTDDLQQYLNRIPVDFVVIDQAEGPVPVSHHRLLIDLLSRQLDHWRLLGSFPQHSQGRVDGAIQLYQRIGAPGSPDKVWFEMQEILHRKLR